MTSIIIAAHNEEALIGRCLDALLDGAGDCEFEVIVVANGCNDQTAEKARSRGINVLELTRPGKAPALNAGDAAARTYPRLYLDADIVLTAEHIRTLAAIFRAGSRTLIVAPRRRVELSGRPLAIRAYYAIQTRLPASVAGLYGRGAIMVSEEGRCRFSAFPNETADDLFLDSLYTVEERAIVDTVTSVVAAPYTLADLMRRLVRVRRGNNQMRNVLLSEPLTDSISAPVRVSDRWSWFRDVVLKRPTLAPAGLFYAALTLVAEFQARRHSTLRMWGSDHSTRLRNDASK